MGAALMLPRLKQRVDYRSIEQPVANLGVVGLVVRVLLARSFVSAFICRLAPALAGGKRFK